LELQPGKSSQNILAPDLKTILSCREEAMLLHWFRSTMGDTRQPNGCRGRGIAIAAKPDQMRSSDKECEA